MIMKSVMGTAALVLSSSLVLITLTSSSTIPSSFPHSSSNLFSCDSPVLPPANFSTCNSPTSTCNTFALLRTSLSNLTSSYLNLDRLAIARANGFPPKTDSLPNDHQPLLIPLTCKCLSSGVFAAQLVKKAVKGDTFSSISESLQGLTTCNRIRAENPNLSASNLAPILVPLKCACPEQLQQKARIFFTYPVIPGDSLSTLSIRFNVSQESIVSANTRPFNLQPFTSVFIPLNATKPPPLIKLRRRFRPEMRRKVGIYIAVVCGVIVGSIAIAAAFFLAMMLLRNKKKKKKPPQKQRKKKQSISSNKDADLELQQLSLSVRTTSDKKVSFESSQQDSLDVPGMATPRKGTVVLESYTVEELRKATEDFNSGNLIEGNVYHGRLNGKNMAVKRLKTDLVSKIEFGILSVPTHHHHPKILRLLGTCLNEEGSEILSSYLVFEYAKNGSLRDWLLGGLAMKNQFIASCYCFLTWNQRLKICLDVAVGLQYMHLIMSPSYVHRNLRTRNIFLDEEFNAKIGNFAMAKLVEEDDSNDDKTKDIGYLAPEYVKNKAMVSPSVDIYAYGVVLLEVLSGKTAADRGDAEKLHENIKDWMDGALGDNYPLDGAVALANLAQTCVEEEPGSRPNAGDIVEKLSELVEELSVEGGGGAESNNNMSLCESSCKPLVKAAAESIR